MTSLEVTPSALRDASSFMLQAAEWIDDELERLERAADELRLAWHGDAHVAFDRSQTRLRFRIRAHGAQLRSIAIEVGKLADAYGELDRNAARALGGQ